MPTLVHFFGGPDVDERYSSQEDEEYVDEVVVVFSPNPSPTDDGDDGVVLSNRSNVDFSNRSDDDEVFFSPFFSPAVDSSIDLVFSPTTIFSTGSMIPETDIPQYSNGILTLSNILT